MKKYTWFLFNWPMYPFHNPISSFDMLILSLVFPLYFHILVEGFIA